MQASSLSARTLAQAEWQVLQQLEQRYRQDGRLVQKESRVGESLETDSLGTYVHIYTYRIYNGYILNHVTIVEEQYLDGNVFTYMVDY